MADPNVVTVLAVFHIVSAVSWFGGLVFFLSAIGPGVRSFTPAASLEFLTKVGPRQTRFFAASATSTIIFGLALYAEVYPSYTATQQMVIEGGAVLGFLAYVVALGVAIPAFRKADRIAHKMMETPQQAPSPAELQKTLKRGTTGAIAIGALLILAFLLMIVTGFYFT